MDINDVQNLGPVIKGLNALAAQFAASNTGFQISSLVLTKGINDGSITFTWDPDRQTYIVSIAQ